MRNEINKLKADLTQKSKILGSTFPEKLFFDGKKCRTPRINEVMRLAMSNDKGFGNKKSEQLAENLEMFGLVDESDQRSKLYEQDLNSLLVILLSINGLIPRNISSNKPKE